MKTTLKDVAAAAGVSMSAASYVLNKTGLHKVGQDTQKAILEAARRLNYTPNVIARGLRRGRSSFIGVMMPYIDSSFVPEIIAGIDHSLNQHDYSMVFCTYSSQEDFEKKCRNLLERQVDGILLKPLNAEVPSRLGELVGAIPCVFVAAPGRDGYPGIYVNPESIGVLAAKALLSAGHRHMAAGPRMHAGGFAALKGEIIKAGAPEPIRLPSDSPEDLERVLRERPEITAVVALDHTAVKIIKVAARLGLSLPQDLSVLGIDGMDFDAYLTPALSSITQPRAEQGQQAAELLIDWIESKKKAASIILQPSICMRDSVVHVRD